MSHETKHWLAYKLIYIFRNHTCHRQGEVAPPTVNYSTNFLNFWIGPRSLAPTLSHLVWGISPAVCGVHKINDISLERDLALKTTREKQISKSYNHSNYKLCWREFTKETSDLLGRLKTKLSPKNENSKGKNCSKTSSNFIPWRYEPLGSCGHQSTECTTKLQDSTMPNRDQEHCTLHIHYSLEFLWVLWRHHPPYFFLHHYVDFDPWRQHLLEEQIQCTELATAKKKERSVLARNFLIKSDCKWKRLIVSNLLQKMRIEKRPYSCCDFVYPVHPIRSIFSLVRV